MTLYTFVFGRKDGMNYISRPFFSRNSQQSADRQISTQEHFSVNHDRYLGILLDLHPARAYQALLSPPNFIVNTVCRVIIGSLSRGMCRVFCVTCVCCSYVLGGLGEGGGRGGRLLVVAPGIYAGLEGGFLGEDGRVVREGGLGLSDRLFGGGGGGVVEWGVVGFE